MDVGTASSSASSLRTQGAITIVRCRWSELVLQPSQRTSRWLWVPGLSFACPGRQLLCGCSGRISGVIQSSDDDHSELSPSGDGIERDRKRSSLIDAICSGIIEASMLRRVYWIGMLTAGIVATGARADDAVVRSFAGGAAASMVGVV